jgi:hypothetical protein
LCFGDIDKSISCTQEAAYFFCFSLPVFWGADFYEWQKKTFALLEISRDRT